MEENNCLNLLNSTECKQDFYDGEVPIVLNNLDVKINQNSVDFILQSNNCNLQNNKLTSENSTHLNEYFNTNQKINKHINIKNLNFHVNNKKNYLEKVLSSKTVINNHVHQIKKIKKSGVNHKFVNNPKQIKSKLTKSYSAKLDSTSQISNLNQNNQLISSDLDKSNKNSLSSNDGPCIMTYSSTQNSTVSTSKGMGCGKPGYITCSICNATKYYSHVQRRFGQFSCEPCSKFMKRFLRDPKVFICIANGVCQIGKPTGEQEPRGVSVNRCKACWLKICLDKFVIDGKTKEVIELHYMPKLKNSLSNKLNKICNNDNDAQNEGGEDEDKESNSQTNLPPLPILNTRKRRTLDSSNSTIIKNKKEDTFDFSKRNEIPYKNKKKTKSTSLFENSTQAKNENKRERKKKEIYSPPSTPKRSKKKSLFKLEDSQKTKSNESVYSCTNLLKLDSNLNSPKKLINKNKDEKTICSEDLGNENNASSDNESNQSFKISIQKKQDEWNNIEINYLTSSNGDNNTSVKEECGKCSYCVNGKNPNVLVVKDTCKHVGYSMNNLSNQKSSFSNNYFTLSREHLIENNEFNDYCIVNNSSDFIKNKSIIFTNSNTNKFEEEDEEELDFKNSLKVINSKNKKDCKLKTTNKTRKTKKRKDILTNNNLLRKSIMKRSNLNYIFNLDSNSVNEILNANSPFL